MHLADPSPQILDHPAGSTQGAQKIPILDREGVGHGLLPDHRDSRPQLGIVGSGVCAKSRQTAMMSTYMSFRHGISQLLICIPIPPAIFC